MVRAYSYKRNKPRAVQESPTPLRFAPTVQPVRVTRKNQNAVGPDFPDRFKAAIQTMISQGNYSCKRRSRSAALAEVRSADPGV